MSVAVAGISDAESADASDAHDWSCPYDVVVYGSVDKLRALLGRTDLPGLDLNTQYSFEYGHEPNIQVEHESLVTVCLVEALGTQEDRLAMVRLLCQDPRTNLEFMQQSVDRHLQSTLEELARHPDHDAVLHLVHLVKEAQEAQAVVAAALAARAPALGPEPVVYDAPS